MSDERAQKLAAETDCSVDEWKAVFRILGDRADGLIPYVYAMRLSSGEAPTAIAHRFKGLIDALETK